MSSTMFNTQDPSPVVTRRSPTVIEDSANGSQRSANRRSLSGKLRNLFRKNSTSPTRTSDYGRSLPPPTTAISSSIRQSSASPVSVRSTSEAPQLRAPTINWSFGKKKNKPPKTPTTPKSNKKKSKDKQKNIPASAPPMEISPPIYQQGNQSSIQGEVFVPRTPEPIYNNAQRIYSTSPTAYNDPSTARGFRDYAIVDQRQSYQQVSDSEVNVFTPPTHTSDRSRSPSMNRQRLTNPYGNDYYFPHDNSISTVPNPLADVEVISTPQRTRNTADMPLSNATNILIEKPPMSPKSSTSRPPSTQPINIVNARTQSKTGSSSSLNKSLTIENQSPKLNAPTISLGSTSNKRKAKRTKSQTRADEVTSSTSTIHKLSKQDPIRPDRSWQSTYGSLPDAEIMSNVSLPISQPVKSKVKEYPGISAIVQHHLLRPPFTYGNERPVIPTSISPIRSPRFDTSTATANPYEDKSSWSQSVNKVPEPTTSTLQRQDGYIRPLTPTQPYIQANIRITRLDGDTRIHQSSPNTYRSSTTVYNQDRRQFINGGEIRTWSSQDNNINNDYNISCTITPYPHVQIDRQYDKPRIEYDQYIPPPKVKEIYEEYRYSPRAHEEELHVKEQKTIHDQEIHEEEQYEVSYEYEQYSSFQTKSHYDELHQAKRYMSDKSFDQNTSYSKHGSTGVPLTQNERDNIYDQPSRSYIENNYRQEAKTTTVPAKKYNGNPRTYTLKRSDSYDGLGMSICADSDTRTNHIIREVEKGSPAERAGLRQNDRIISVNGVNVENIDFGDVLMLVREGLNNDNLQVSVIHEID